MLRRPTDETDPKDWFLFASDRLQGADRQAGEMVELIGQRLPAYF
jgi:hypothetical protein